MSDKLSPRQMGALSKEFADPEEVFFKEPNYEEDFGYYKLWTAVLVQALKCAKGIKTGNFGEEEERECREWLYNPEESRWLFKLLGIDRDAFMDKFLQIKTKRGVTRFCRRLNASLATRNLSP